MLGPLCIPLIYTSIILITQCADLPNKYSNISAFFTGISAKFEQYPSIETCINGLGEFATRLDTDDDRIQALNKEIGQPNINNTDRVFLVANFLQQHSLLSANLIWFFLRTSESKRCTNGTRQYGFPFATRTYYRLMFEELAKVSCCDMRRFGIVLAYLAKNKWTDATEVLLALKRITAHLPVQKLTEQLKINTDDFSLFITGQCCQVVHMADPERHCVWKHINTLEESEKHALLLVDQFDIETHALYSTTKLKNIEFTLQEIAVAICGIVFLIAVQGAIFGLLFYKSQRSKGFHIAPAKKDHVTSSDNLK